MKFLFYMLIIALTKFTCNAQLNDTVLLPDPVKQEGKALMQALNERHSSREYVDKELTLQQMADMLWAAYGINRKDGRRTVPSARNKQEIDVYVTTAEGVFLYDALENSLVRISGDDIRGRTGGQPWVKTAAVNIIYVCDKTRAASQDERGVLVNAAFTAGACAQNVYLYCASEGIGSVVRGSFNGDELRGLLKLNDNQVIVMAQTVGYTK
ncbi:MAG: SagB/ThcOx family dehydrogenase [Bacteroidales bacterium]|nr:SagB/ThcOx family dehydrogenase [Bacteroidales bacterium]